KQKGDTKDTSEQQQGPAQKESEGGGFDFKGLVAKLLDQPGLKTIKDIIDTAAEIYDALANVVGKIISFFKNWFGGAIDAVTAVLKGFAKYGIFGYLKIVLREKLGDTLYEIVEPLLDALDSFEKRVMDLLDLPLPSGLTGFL